VDALPGPEARTGGETCSFGAPHPRAPGRRGLVEMGEPLLMLLNREKIGTVENVFVDVSRIA
jgi:hypothetical protein